MESQRGHLVIGGRAICVFQCSRSLRPCTYLCHLWEGAGFWDQDGDDAYGAKATESKQLCRCTLQQIPQKVVAYINWKPLETYQAQDVN